MLLCRFAGRGESRNEPIAENPPYFAVGGAVNLSHGISVGIAPQKHLPHNTVVYIHGVAAQGIVPVPHMLCEFTIAVIGSEGDGCLEYSFVAGYNFSFVQAVCVFLPTNDALVCGQIRLNGHAHHVPRPHLL